MHDAASMADNPNQIIRCHRAIECLQGYMSALFDFDCPSSICMGLGVGSWPLALAVEASSWSSGLPV